MQVIELVSFTAAAVFTSMVLVLIVIMILVMVLVISVTTLVNTVV